MKFNSSYNITWARNVWVEKEVSWSHAWANIPTISTSETLSKFIIHKLLLLDDIQWWWQVAAGKISRLLINFPSYKLSTQINLCGGGGRCDFNFIPKLIKYWAADHYRLGFGKCFHYIFSSIWHFHDNSRVVIHFAATRGKLTNALHFDDLLIKTFNILSCERAKNQHHEGKSHQRLINSAASFSLKRIQLEIALKFHFKLALLWAVSKRDPLKK